MDAPCTSWEKLVKLAEDRNNWKRRVNKLKDSKSSSATGPASSTHSMRTRSQSATTNSSKSTAMATTLTKRPPNKSEAQLYRERDAHEAFFRPTLAMPATQQRRTKKKKKKRTELTNKQRAAEAKAHYILHHDSKSDAHLFLDTKANTDNISASTHAALTLM